MKHYRKLWVCTLAVCVAALASAGAVFAATATKTSTRDKALAECLAATKAQVPEPYVVVRPQTGSRDPSNEARRVYRDCMRKKGFRP